ncbi:MAG: hypothetical protein ACREX8_02865 [Gammaproteobacteria bacterium]
MKHTKSKADTTLIATRRGHGSSGRWWLTFDGVLAATLTMSDEPATRLVELLSEAS